jgi:hypothetical protein
MALPEIGQRTQHWRVWRIMTGCWLSLWMQIAWTETPILVRVLIVDPDKVTLITEDPTDSTPRRWSIRLGDINAALGLAPGILGILVHLWEQPNGDGPSAPHTVRLTTIPDRNLTGDRTRGVRFRLSRGLGDGANGNAAGGTGNDAGSGGGSGGGGR